MIVRVLIGALKLTKLICRAAKIDSPVSLNGRSSGVTRSVSRSSIPRASSSRISVSMITITGRIVKNTSSTDQRPAPRRR
jgi:hypothetical protein